MIKQVIWSSTIDYPDQNSTVLFLDGCNFKCSYCHNKELSLLPDMPFKNILTTLNERKSFIDHVILSGGEPTISPAFGYIVKALHDNNFKVGIHTNGSNFEAFEKVKDKISFIGLDIKCKQSRLHEFGDMHLGLVMSISSYLDFFSTTDVQYEIRTTLDAGMTIEELINIARGLKFYNIKGWILQPEFKKGERQLYFNKMEYNTILNKLNEIIPTRFRSIL